MNRINRHQMWMDVADVFARRSTCMRLNVGAVIVDPIAKRMLSHGYNGPPAGDEHCTGRTCADPSVGCLRARHAETNAIERLSPFDINKSCVMYVTDSPCPGCFDRIVKMPTITALYFRQPYRLCQHLIGSPIPIYRLTPSGFIIDYATGELVNDDVR